MSFFEKLDFNNAIRRIKTDRKNDPIIDITGYRDFFSSRDRVLEELEKNLNEIDRYSAKYGISINIPKKNFTLRPAMIPKIEDRLLYQAIADILIPHYTPEPLVFSNIPNPITNSYIFKHGVESWLKFQDEIIKKCEEYDYVVETDITAYFEHISHRLLKSRLKDLFSEKLGNDDIRTVNILLGKMLNRWGYSYLRGFGIPQINDVSSFFGNIYLDDLDKWLLKLDYPAFRYVDDIRIFTKDKYSARKALNELIIKLRSMGLFISSAKTEIKESLIVLTDLLQRNEKLNQIDEELESRDEERITEISKEILNLVKENYQNGEIIDGRVFRFCINRLKRLKATGIEEEIHDEVIPIVLSSLSSMPSSTDIFVDYLSMFPNNEDIQRNVVDFINSEKNIYNWQEMHLINYLIRSNISTKNWSRWRNYFVELARSSDNLICSSYSIVLWGKNGDYSDRRDIRELYFNADNFKKRSIVIGIQEMQKNERDNFYRENCQTDFDVRFLVNYLEKLSTPIYHYFNPPTGYEIFNYDIEDDSDDIRFLNVEDFS